MLRIALLALLAAGCSLALDGERFNDERFDAGPGGGADGQGDQGADTRPDAGPGGPAPDGGGGGGDGDGDGDEEPAMCSQECGGGDCSLRCPEGSDCDCQLDCAGTDDTCKPECNGTDCSIDCTGVNNCEPKCKNGSACTIDCRGANNCEKARCEEGAACVLHCEGANNCEFDRCDGEEQSCPGDVVVCNRPCP